MINKYKKLLFPGVFLVISTCLCAQDYITHTGFVSFFGEKPFDDIRADNHEVESSINTKTGEVEFHTMIRSFHFRNKKMEQKFNDEYMESDRYPESYFVGKITDLADIDFNTPGEYHIMVEGNLTIHNVTQRVSHPGIITVTADGLSARSLFTVKPDDFKVKLPTMFGKEMATEINVSVDMQYSRRTRVSD